MDKATERIPSHIKLLLIAIERSSAQMKAFGSQQIQSYSSSVAVEHRQALQEGGYEYHEQTSNMMGRPC